jgi:hypothetical protein
MKCQISTFHIAFYIAFSSWIQGASQGEDVVEERKGWVRMQGTAEGQGEDAKE